MRIFADCPKCHSILTYKDGAHFICVECTHEWPQEGATATVIHVSAQPPRNDSKALIRAVKAKAGSPWWQRKSAARRPVATPSPPLPQRTRPLESESL